MFIILILVLMINAVFMGHLELFISFPASVLSIFIQIPLAVWIGFHVYRRHGSILIPSIIVLVVMYFTVIIASYVPALQIDFVRYFGGETNVVLFGLTGVEMAFLSSIITFMVYLSIASTLPVWQLILGLAILYAGLFVTNPENFAIPRSPQDEVFDQIIEDLTFAENNLPSSYSQADLGRATSWAATSILATVYLWQERWGDAAAKAREVINSGQFSLLEVEEPEDFQNMFGPDILTHPEEIFSLKHSRNSGLGHGAIWLMHRAGSGYSLGNNAHAWFGNMDSWLGDWMEELEGPDLRPNDWFYNGPEDERWLDSEIPMLFKKFRDTESSTPGNDHPIIRYTEIKLIFAEAESQLNNGPTEEAYEAINMVRRRAYGLDYNQPSAEADLPAGLSAQAFRDELMLERAKEFIMEGKRWYDMLRTGTAIELISALGYPIQERHLLWPIPSEEIDNNDALTQEDQNPGW